MTSLNFDSFTWLLLGVCGLLIGMGKTGISGAGLLVVPIMASVFGGKVSSGLVLPMLSIADIFAVFYYNRHAEWKYLLKLFPATTAGIAFGIIVGDAVNDEQFKKIIAFSIFISLGIMIWQQRKRSQPLPNNWFFSSLAGLTGGFATMIGNAAGPLMAVYLLSMHLPKNTYIGTSAWFFLIVNLIKIPLQIYFWGSITPESLQLNLLLLPLILLGAMIGIFSVQKIPEKAYRIFVIVMTAVASIKLFF